MSDFKETFDQINNTADTTAQFDSNDIQQNKIMAVLSYISWLVLIPLIFANKSRFARFHVNQGLVLAVVEVVSIFLLRLLGHLPLIGWIFSIVASLMGLVCLIFAIIGIINAASGKAKELPIIGFFKILK